MTAPVKQWAEAAPDGEPNRLYVEDGRLYQVGTDLPVMCSWTATCERHAAEVVGHPMLGGVPTCAHHVEWIGQQSA